MCSHLSSKPKPTDAVTECMDKLGFKPEVVAMRQEFYDDLRSFHQDPQHLYRRSLNTKVSDSQVNQEIVSFMRGYGDYYFGSINRGHLFDDAKTYRQGTTELRILDDFPAVKSAFLSLSQNYNRQQKRLQNPRKRRSEDAVESSSERSRTTSQSPNGDSHYAPSERPSSERSERIRSYHGSKSNASRWNRPPTPVQMYEQRSKSYRSSPHGSHIAWNSTTVSNTALEKHRRRTTGDRATDQAVATEPWDASGNTVDWDQVPMKMDGPTNGHLNDRYPTRARASSKSANTFEQPTRKRTFQDTGDYETSTKSKVSLGSRSTVYAQKRHRSCDAPPQQPGLEVHFCARNNRGAFEKWSHGGLRGHTVETFFELFYESCNLRGRLNSITFRLDDADPPRHWTVEERDAIMFDHVRDKMKRILSEDKYAGIFEILMEPTVEIDEDDVGNTIVLDF